MPAAVDLNAVARVARRLDTDVVIAVPPVPRWRGFILEAEADLQRVTMTVEFYANLQGKVALGAYFELADPAEWNTPKGVRALQLMQAALDQYMWGLTNPLPVRTAVSLVKDPKVGRQKASYFVYRRGAPVVVLDRAHVDELDESAGLTVTDADRKFLDFFLHEVGHAIMSFNCGPKSLQDARRGLTEIRKAAGWLRSSVVGVPFSIVPGAYDWIYQLYHGLWGKDRYDFMSQWCEASGWVIDEPEKGLGWLGWRTEPPNIFLSESGKLFNLRNLHGSPAQRDRLVFLFDRGLDVERKRLAALVREKPPNATAIAKQSELLRKLEAEAERLRKAMKFVTQYAATDPGEDWAECVSQPFARGVKIADPGRRKFLAERGLPETRRPVDLGKWLGVPVQPVTKIGPGQTTVRPPLRAKQVKTLTAASESDAAEASSLPEQTVWSEFTAAMTDLRAAMEETSGETVSATAGVLRALAPASSDAFEALRIGAGRGAGLVAVTPERIGAAAGDVLFASDNRVYIVASADAAGIPERLVGHVGPGAIAGAPVHLNPATLVARWRPSAAPRKFTSGTAMAKTAASRRDARLRELIGWWARSSVTVRRASYEVSTGPEFARAWLKLCDAKPRLPISPAMGDLERALKIGPKHPTQQVRPGDLVRLHRDACGVVLTVDERSRPTEIIVGGAGKRGVFGEDAGAVRVLISASPIAIVWAWRMEQR